MISATFKNKTSRICLSCMNGLIIADNTTNESQKVYCLDCGTQHSVKFNKNGTVRVERFDKKLKPEKLKKLNIENLEFIEQYVFAIARYFKERGVDVLEM
ncbi:MAG: hypothetical protein ACRCX2_30460 [Paraclostridium sp.]